LAEAVTLALELDDVTPMSQAVQQWADAQRIPEDLAPIGEGQVGGHQQRAPQITLADKGEEHIHPLLGERNKAHLVDDNEVVKHEKLFDPAEPMLLGGFQKGIDQAGRGEEAHPPAELTGCQADTDGQMRFAGTDSADKQHIRGRLQER